MRNLLTLLLFIVTSACGLDQDLVDTLIVSEDVTLVFPENVSECTEGTIVSETQSEVVFQWTDNVLNKNYEVNLTNLISNTTEVFPTDSTALAITLDRGIPYSWFIADAASGNARSDVWTFYNAGPGIESFIPFPAEAIAPVTATTIETTSSVNLIWNAVDLDDDSIAYDIYFGADENPALLQESVTDSFINDVPVSSGETYYWKITTKDFIGNESYSELFRFQVE